MDLDLEKIVVQLDGLPDLSDETESRSERLEDLIAKVILLGKRRGRPRKEEIDYEEESAA